MFETHMSKCAQTDVPRMAVAVAMASNILLALPRG